MSTTLNPHGGVIPDPQDRRRAQDSDLGTLPLDIPGTNCANCKYFKQKGYVSRVKGLQVLEVTLGFCQHPRVLQEVTDRMCCCFWDNPGYQRDW